MKECPKCRYYRCHYCGRVVTIQQPGRSFTLRNPKIKHWMCGSCME
jgi:uncharacterized protein YlaI